MRKNKKYPLLTNVQVSGYAAGGKALARVDGKVIFITGAVPGDVVNVQLIKNKKDWGEGFVAQVIEYSKDRTVPFCEHFGVCGGCKWQMLPYEKQLEYKQQEVEETLIRIGKAVLPKVMPILGSSETIHYRNKLEFTFSDRRYLTREEVKNTHTNSFENALGYHAPQIFDKVIDIRTCWLMDDVNNRVRNTVRSFALAHNLSFYNIRQHTGWLRNLMIRHCTTGELMVNLCINYRDDEALKLLFDHLLLEIPEITTLLYTINTKWNDSIYDLEPQVYFGRGYVTEKLGDFSFIISPKSFFQTNTKQAEVLYRVVQEFAGLTGVETVYDLYCGTGSIGIFLSKQAGRIVGVETVAEAVEDAKKNAALNGIEHAEFFCGDVIDICNSTFFNAHGFPDIIITDPPRAGMHEKLVLKLLEISAPKIVYVSCNVATQARDIALLLDKYQVEKVQPLDMFPHTHHIESVVLLTLR